MDAFEIYHHIPLLTNGQQASCLHFPNEKQTELSTNISSFGIGMLIHATLRCQLNAVLK